MSGEDIVELGIAGVVLILLGSALAPILPFNFAAIGWLMIALAVFLALAMVVVGAAQVLDAISG
ncbi:hypothetical protein [Halopelagius longus]|uniref:Uncharacterized protein n=1 Tax=Halopelagius longus TaxID=1236180 RepID=A0A370IMR4_9EURY|nr:hypothetical protein [Halopelagius longus]RDI71976.1 hypothetical protein DWB78_09720 [Halopelagius longus]